MIEPGDWVVITVDWANLRVGLAGQVVETSPHWIWVQTNGKEGRWPSVLCRKLSEHEVMERLRDV